jgi:hypothetical protein
VPWLLLAVFLLAGSVAVPRLFGQSLTWLGGDWSFMVGTNEPSPVGPEEWRQAEFDDTSWPRGPMGFGAGNNLEATSVPPLAGTATSLYLRRRFSVTNLVDIGWLWLRLDVQSGAAVYLNGAEVFRTNLAGVAGDFVPHDAVATNAARTGPQLIDLSAALPLLHDGDNVLAFQVHTTGPMDGDLVCLADLLANFTRGPAVQRLDTDTCVIHFRTTADCSSTIGFGTNSTAENTLVLSGLTNVHFAVLTNLAEGASYHYQVTVSDGERTGRSENRTFLSGKHSGPVTFAVIGDTGAGNPAQYRVAQELAAADAELVLHLGDIIYLQFTTERTDFRCLSVYQPQMAQVPFYFTVGNHDLYSGSDAPFLDAFVLPTNSMSGTPHYYSFDQGDVHFVSLFVPTLQAFPEAALYGLGLDTPHYQWLTNDLAQTTKPWKVAFFHSPMTDSAFHRFDDYNGNGVPDRLEIQALLQPVFERYGVQVVFNGHEHCFERFQPTNGVHRIVSGGGGGTLYGILELDPDSLWFESAYHHLRASVSGDWMKLQAVDINGRVMDSTTIPRTPPAPDLDSDGDGVSDVSELAAGSDPQDAASFLKLEIKPQPGGPLLWWRTIPGRHYDLQTTSNAAAPHASGVPSFPRTAQGTNDSFPAAAPDRDSRFYRLKVAP